MIQDHASPVGTIATLYRYPVKSMLGETCTSATVSDRGIVGDRRWAVLDAHTGKVASAKRPKLWRGLLTCTGRTLGAEAGVEVELGDGTRLLAGDQALDDRLSALTGRAVRLADIPPGGAELDRAYPEAQTDEGPEADVAFGILALGAAAPGGTFFDYAALHLLTTGTIDGLGDGLDEQGRIEPQRYRPNIVIRSAANTPTFPENTWLGGTVRIGRTVTLQIVLQTPRCAIPALAHGVLPRRPEALRATATRNRLVVPGFGDQPCAGVYAEVLQGGMIAQGDPVTFAPATSH